MNYKNRIFYFLSICSILIVAFGCRKDNPNINPSIKFLQPNSNLIIEKDTVLSVLVEPDDPDGDIDRIEFYFNDSLINTLTDEPFQFDWNIVAPGNIGIHTLKAIVFDDENATGEAVITIEIRDFRNKYYGDFYFTTIKENWIEDQPTIYDTIYHHGFIRKFELEDRIGDLFGSYNGDDSDENPDEKITIVFSEKLTSLLNPNGELVTKVGMHYYHEGKFVTTDSIMFEVTGLGGLGGGWNYYVKGIRE